MTSEGSSVSAAAIVETLAKEFSVDRAHAQRVFDLLSTGLKAPTIARYRRAEVGTVADGTIRRFARRMRQLDELEKRRASLLRSIAEQRKAADRKTGEADEPAKQEDDLAALRSCMESFELEDLFLPHRRPEPEVQLALDRGLGQLADLLVREAPKRPPEPESSEESPEESPEESSEEPTEGAVVEAPEKSAEGTAEGEPAMPADPDATAAPEDEPADATSVAGASAEDGGASEAPVVEAEAGKAAPEKKRVREPYLHAAHIDVSPQLARLCAPFVNPDRGIHNEEAALDGAMRILSDRLGRNASLRGTLRRMMRKHGRLRVRLLVEERKLGRNRSLLKLDAPLRQIQGHRLLALRQAQAQRLIATSITIQEPLVLAKVRAALGKRLDPDYASVAEVVAEQALRQRLLPMIEDDVRNELRNRADEEAIRFLAQHLRQVLLAPPAGPRMVAGLHVDAKGDWLIVVVDRDGKPMTPEFRIEASGDDPVRIAESLGETLRSSGVRTIAVGHGKAAREAVHKLRLTIAALKANAHVFLVNEAGLSSYANSEIARRELADWSVPARQAISLARRNQDSLCELLKSDLRHLGLGREQSVISKANLRRVLYDTVESCVAYVGCDLNTAPLSFLRHVPGLSFELARKLVERRAERPFTSREELRTEGLLDDLSWTNAVGFLRVADSTEPLDRTAIHPEQYDLARRIILESGSSIEEALGRRDALRRVRREDFGVDEATWRDLVRDISQPGRDPRPRLFLPQLLPPDADAKGLEKGHVVEGIVSNVASFGAFVDLGVPRDGMIHISEISNRYVRDARILLSIGQVVRARVLDASGQRVELSLKNVPEIRRRSDRGDRSRSECGQRHRGRRSAEGSGEIWPETQPTLRAARSRRDGLVGGRPTREKRRSKAGSGNRRGPGGRRREADEGYDSTAIREASHPAGSYNPFATFFKDKGETEEPPAGEGTSAS